jgi:hypothetical protein
LAARPRLQVIQSDPGIFAYLDDGVLLPALQTEMHERALPAQRARWGGIVIADVEESAMLFATKTEIMF